MRTNSEMWMIKLKTINLRRKTILSRARSSTPSKLRSGSISSGNKKIPKIPKIKTQTFCCPMMKSMTTCSSKDTSNTLNIIIHHMGIQPNIITIGILNLAIICPIFNNTLTSKEEKEERQIKRRYKNKNISIDIF